MRKLSCLIILVVIAACNNPKAVNENIDTTTPDSSVPAVISWQLINSFPHDPHAFTEGLQYADGCLYESAGQYGSSDIRKTDLTTGKILLLKALDKKYFGEGLAVLNGKVYQLTYKEHTGFVYDAATLKQEKTFSFTTEEGWGMTTDGKSLIFDDGSNNLNFLDPNTLQLVKQISVQDEHGPVNAINELEYIKGYIYANQWQTDYILKIDPNSGRVIARADLSDLRERVGIPPLAGDPHGPEVLNGIAYDAVGNRIFITGKYWPKLLEVKLDN